MQGFLKENYRASQYPISSLALAKNGWLQVASFLISGPLIILFSFYVYKKLNSKLITVLFILIGIGLTASGIFSTDALFGYPQNQPYRTMPFTLQGKLHTAFSLLVFFGIPLICFFMSRQFGKAQKIGWKYYSIASAIIMLMLFVLTGIAFGRVYNLHVVAGLLQRLCVVAGFVWISLFAPATKIVVV